MTGKEFYKELTNISHTHSDRYKGCKLLEEVDTGELLLSTREILDIASSSTDMYHRIKSNEVSRLDLLASEYYNNPLLWWVIAQANEIYDPFVPLEVGTLIRIPTIESLYGNNGILL